MLGGDQGQIGSDEVSNGQHMCVCVCPQLFIQPVNYKPSVSWEERD